jgi:hypothetical protein
MCLYRIVKAFVGGVSACLKALRRELRKLPVILPFMVLCSLPRGCVPWHLWRLLLRCLRG